MGLGRAGIVLGLEVSRLARNSTDWHRLLEICALTGTLILDEDGLYDPCCFNDRLLLGLKGTMSEAELHLIRARLQGGIRNKALRGELKSPLPVGLIYDELAPDVASVVLWWSSNPLSSRVMPWARHSCGLRATAASALRAAMFQPQPTWATGRT